MPQTRDSALISIHDKGAASFARGWPLVRFLVVAGRSVSPLPRHLKRLGVSGVWRGFYGLASALDGGGGVAGCREGVHFPVLLGLGTFLH